MAHGTWVVKSWQILEIEIDEKFIKTIICVE